jgi:hypothetical protein
MQRSAKLTLTALIVVCTLPVVASYVTYYFWQPDETMNYGELIEPVPLPEARASGLSAEDVDLDSLRGRWTMVYAGGGACNADGQHALYTMRQSWLAQGEEMRRVDRLWLLTDAADPAPEALDDQRGLKVARSVDVWADRLPEGDQGRHIYLVDPLGNVMLRFPAEPDPKRVMKDLQRLLKYSRL